jgi:hypothetical protein
MNQLYQDPALLLTFSLAPTYYDIRMSQSSPNPALSFLNDESLNDDEKNKKKSRASKN